MIDESAEPESGHLAAEAERLRKKLRDAQPVVYRQRFLIDPRQSKWLPIWDGLTSFCLVITALVTPLEVAFMARGR
jgi:hypothetical protein